MPEPQVHCPDLTVQTKLSNPVSDQKSKESPPQSAFARQQLFCHSIQQSQKGSGFHSVVRLLIPVLGVGAVILSSMVTPSQGRAHPFQPGLPPIERPESSSPANRGVGSVADPRARWPDPGAPTTGRPGAVGGVGYGSSAGLLNLNYACPLVDKDANSDLLASLDLLERAIKSGPEECRNDASLSDAIKKQEQMKRAAEELRRIWSDPENMNQNLSSFDANLQVMVTGIGALSQTLANNSLISSRCGREAMDIETAVIAFSDLVTSLAPYALFAAAAASSLKAAVPYVLGVVGLSSVVKMVTDLRKNKTFDMHKYEHQQVVLKATCEYMRVATKVRYLLLAQSGKVEELTKEINRLNTALNYHVGDSENGLNGLLNERQIFYSAIDSLRVKMYSDLRMLRKQKYYLEQYHDDTSACSMGFQLVEAHRRGAFPFTVDANFKNLEVLALARDEMILRATGLQYATEYRRLESAVNGGENEVSSRACGAATRSFLDTLDRMLRTMEEELFAQENLFEGKLSQNEEYRNWYKNTSILERDRETLERVVLTLQKTNQESSVMSQTILHQRLESLRNQLLGSKSIFVYTISPVESWLRHTHIMYASAISYFNTATSDLFDQIKEMRLSEPKPRRPYYRERTFSIWPRTAIYDLIFVDHKYENLRFINKNKFPIGSDHHRKVCVRLEEIWLRWSEAMDHFRALKHFCSTIETFIDSKTGSGVVSICGRVPIHKSTDPNSLIAQSENLLDLKGYRNTALTISKKMDELKCLGR